MINFSKFIGFSWDDGNSRKSFEKHIVSQAEAEQTFFNSPLLLLPDEKHSNKEVRYHAYGKTDKDRKLHITFTLRQDSTLVRVISARDMHRNERVMYDKA
jgi:uncharacterized DUF497 family protein